MSAGTHVRACTRRALTAGSHACTHPAGKAPWRASNVAVGTRGQLVLQVTRSGSGFTAGQAVLDRSLGFGDYVFVTSTPPARLHHGLAASPMIYASRTNEFDIAFSRWANKRGPNAQYVVHPAVRSPPRRFNVTTAQSATGLLTHRLRWSGGSKPSQLRFEMYAANGQLLQLWTPTSEWQWRTCEWRCLAACRPCAVAHAPCHAPTAHCRCCHIQRATTLRQALSA